MLFKMKLNLSRTLFAIVTLSATNCLQKKTSQTLQSNSDEKPADMMQFDPELFGVIDFAALCESIVPPIANNSEKAASTLTVTADNKLLVNDKFYSFFNSDSGPFRVKEWKGAGAFGSVFWAKLQDKTSLKAETIDIAVKVFKPNSNKEINVVQELLTSHRLTSSRLCPKKECVAGILPILALGTLKSTDDVGLTLEAASFPLATANLTVLLDQLRLDSASNAKDMLKRLMGLAEIWNSLHATISKFEDNNLVHGDIKTSNVLIRDGKLEIADFDSVKEVGKHKNLFATPANGAPEQFANAVLKGTDRFATANLILELAGFHNLFELSNNTKGEKITFDQMSAFFKEPNFDQKVSNLFGRFMQLKSLAFRANWMQVEHLNPKTGKTENINTNQYFTSMIGSLRKTVYLDPIQRTFVPNNWTELGTGTKTIEKMISTFLANNSKCKLPSAPK